MDPFVMFELLKLFWFGYELYFNRRRLAEKKALETALEECRQRLDQLEKCERRNIL